MGSRQIVLVSTAGISVRNTGIFWREAKTKRLFSQCAHPREFLFYVSHQHMKIESIGLEQAVFYTKFANTQQVGCV